MFVFSARQLKVVLQLPTFTFEVGQLIPKLFLVSLANTLLLMLIKIPIQLPPHPLDFLGALPDLCLDI